MTDLAGLSALTILCGITDPARVQQALSDSGFVVDPEEGWKVLEIRSSSGDMTITKREFQPGGGFSQIILGIHAAVRREMSNESEGAAGVLSLLERCDLMLGLRFEPELSADDARAAAVIAVSTATEGLIFDGVVIRAPNGNPLIGVTSGKADS